MRARHAASARDLPNYMLRIATTGSGLGLVCDPTTAS
jgi:hypothetical protein